MATKYIVHGCSNGTDGDAAPAGATIRKVIEAASAKEAEAIAARLGMEVLGSEVAEWVPPPAPNASLPDAFASSVPGSSPSPIAANTPEAVKWSGHPSQWTNFWWFASCLLVLPIPFAVAAWLQTKYTKYIVTNQRLRLERGVISRSVEEIELYRVTDSAIAQSFVERMLGLGNIWIETSDKRNPSVLLQAVPDPMAMREMIRGLSEERRRWRRVGELEVS